MKFLVVDDSNIARARVCEYTSDLGYEVIGEAIDGIDAIKKFKDLSPDIITIDLEMPNMNGLEASKEILKLNPNVNIILITSKVNKKDLVNALRIGIKKIIMKPFSNEVFEETVNNVILGVQD